MQNLDPIGTLFENSWKRFEERFAVGIAIFAAPSVLIVLSELLLLRGMPPAAHLLGGIIDILSVIVSLIASIALISAFGKNTSFAASYQAGIKLFWSYIWISILVCLAIFGGLIMLIIPGIILMVQLSLTQFSLVLDDKHGMAALKQSRAYVKDYWWAFIGRLLLLVLIFMVAALVILAPLSLLLGSVAGIILYVACMLFITPFAVSYEYEIFHNLRRLKPDVAEQAAKSDSSFVKVSMVVGIVGIVLVPIFIVGAVAFWGIQFTHYWNGQPATGGYGSTSGQAIIDPMSGPVGTTITIKGLDDTLIGSTETVLMDNLIAARNVPITDSPDNIAWSDGSFTFTIPENLAPNCDPDQVCAQYLVETSPQVYSIFLEQSAHDSSPIAVGVFAVTTSTVPTVGSSDCTMPQPSCPFTQGRDCDNGSWGPCMGL
jgi:hypothetical protein